MSLTWVNFGTTFRTAAFHFNKLNHRLHGKDRIAFIESLLVGDIAGLATGQARLSLLTNETGGIIDDCVVSSYEDHLYMVVNAGNKDIDLDHIETHLESFQGDVALEVMEDRALVALQGPGAMQTLLDFLPKRLDLTTMPFMSGLSAPINGIDCIITRCGYTGEDGFEISIPNEKAVEIAQAFVNHTSVLPAGLGARDSLRLEAGLCLHGHDITPETTPVEAGLTWTIGKRRRSEANFPGASIILDQIKQKSNTKKRVGFVMPKGTPPAREGAMIFHGKDQVGVVTSGTLSPMLKHPIGMAYVYRGHFKIGTELKVHVRNKELDLELTKMPFVPSRYFS